MKQDILLEKLHNIQETYGYIPEAEIDKIAQKYDMPRAKVYGVIRFYSMFYTEPTGKYIIRVCNSLSCHINGSEEIVEVIKNYLGIDDGETTEDRKFTLEVMRCIGACGLAPAITIDDKVYKMVNPDKIESILNNY